MNNYDLLQNILKYVSKQIEDNQYQSDYVAESYDWKFHYGGKIVAYKEMRRYIKKLLRMLEK